MNIDAIIEKAREQKPVYKVTLHLNEDEKEKLISLKQLSNIKSNNVFFKTLLDVAYERAEGL